MTSLFFSVLVCFFSLTAAASSCLQNATDSDLLAELGRRLNSSGGGGGSADGAIATITCDSSNNMHISTVLPDTGKSQVYDRYIGSSCADYATSLRRVSNVGLSRSVLISVCDSSNNMAKILLTPAGDVKETSVTYIGSSCKQQALDANANLMP